MRAGRTRSGRSRLVVEPHRAVALGVVGPLLAHLHVQEQVDLAFEQLLQLGAGGFADGADLAAALAEDDGALAVALDEDHLADAHVAIVELLPRLGLARRSEERRVGKECVSTCRSRWSPYH